jgi:hypothetical protein
MELELLDSAREAIHAIVHLRRSTNNWLAIRTALAMMAGVGVGAFAETKQEASTR